MPSVIFSAQNLAYSTLFNDFFLFTTTPGVISF